MTEPLVEFLGKPVSVLLSSGPFGAWSFKRSVDEDLPIRLIDYVFSNHGFSVTCDSNDVIRSMFIEAPGFDGGLLDISFLSSRETIRALLGAPTKAGEPTSHPILGSHGAWDRFDEIDHSIHVEYSLDAKTIVMITLMRPDTVP